MYTRLSGRLGAEFDGEIERGERNETADFLSHTPTPNPRDARAADAPARTFFARRVPSYHPSCTSGMAMAWLGTPAAVRLGLAVGFSAGALVAGVVTIRGFLAAAAGAEVRV